MTCNVHSCAQYDCCYHLRAEDVELIEMVAQGLRTRQIASRRQCPPHTIRNRLTTFYRMFDVPGRASLVRRATEMGLLSPDSSDEYCIGRYPRQADVELIELVSQGLQNKEIAWRLHRSPHTINHRLRELSLALGVHSRTSLVRRALSLGLLKVESGHPEDQAMSRS